MGQVVSACNTCTEQEGDQVNVNKIIDTDKQIRKHSQSEQSLSIQSSSVQSSSLASSGVTPNSFDLNKVDSLFEDLAKFMRDLPARSKGQIWRHSVKFQTSDGSKTVSEKANNEQLIVKLLSDVVIVYVKYLDRTRDPLTTKQVKPHVERAAKWIFEKYHEIERLQFETDTNYFSNILEAYQGRS